ncbi:unnamed protein product [Rhizophagus irregularis]|nr:unnamed protein product [Rhizophagus irregularis]
MDLFDFDSSWIKGTGLNEPDFKDAGLNTKPDFKDAGLDTNWSLRAPAWTIRREIRLLVLRGLRRMDSMEVSVSSTLRLESELGYADMVLRLGLGYADMASDSFSVELWMLASLTSSVGFLDVVDQSLRFLGFGISYMGFRRYIPSNLFIFSKVFYDLDADLKWLFGSLWTYNSRIWNIRSRDFSSDLDTGFPRILPSDKAHVISRTGPFSETYNISNPNISNSNTPNSNILNSNIPNSNIPHIFQRSGLFPS